MRYLMLLLLFAGPGRNLSLSQSVDTLHREILIDFETRPRAEFRDHFLLTAADSSMPELYASQRNRFGISYNSNRFKFHASPQEIHLWGKSGNASRIGSINAFEFYVEPALTRNISVRIGRQAISLDNGRLFSAAPWSQQGRAHEGIRIFYNNKVTTDLTVAFTRRYGKLFDVAYSPIASHQYKLLLVHHLRHKLNRYFSVTTINTMEVFENTLKNANYYRRITNGGRLEYSNKRIYGTVNAYYQYGSNAGSQKIRAYYVQPEISAASEKTTLRLGAEILSGNKTGNQKKIFNSFVPLYGVTWKFMGNMNLFTRFPADVNSKGLINPYLFVIYQHNKKLSFRADAHLFYTQYQLTSPDNKDAGKYLGFESDVSFNYKPVKRTEIIFGFSSTFATKRMELLGKVVDADKIPVWSYLMISFSPRLLHHQMVPIPRFDQ